MKVLHVLTSNKFSGAENVVCQIINMFRDMPGIEMAYCSPFGDISETLNERKIKYIPLKKLKTKYLTSAIKEYNPNIIHAHDMRASFAAARAAKSCPIISHIHNNAFGSRKVSLKSLGFLWASKRINHIFWVSNSAMSDFRFSKKIEAKSSVLSNIIDVDSLYKRMCEDTNTYNYDIVYLGRLTYPKNPHRLLKIVRIVKHELPNIKVAIIGTGELEFEIKEYAKELDLSNNVDFLGFRSNPLKILHDAKAMLMTSRWEGLPMCALEAMALGVPIVSTPTDGLKNIVSDNITGFLSDDDYDLAEKIVTVILNPHVRDSLSSQSLKRSRELNDMNSYKHEIIKYYDLAVQL